jgi:cadmium resistance protein CadD (predicted permease)
MAKRKALDLNTRERRKRIALIALTVITAASSIANLGVYLWSIENDKGRLAIFLNSFEISVILFTVFLGVLLATPSINSIDA